MLRVARYGLRVAKRIVHSVQIDNSEIADKPDALPYALCAMR